jgi:drug/metabolite transporter (DMT)-like permease
MLPSQCPAGLAAVCAIDALENTMSAQKQELMTGFTSSSLGYNCLPGVYTNHGHRLFCSNAVERAMPHLYGIILVFLAACSYGGAAIVIKLAYHAGLQPAGLLPLQNLLAVACLWPWMLMSCGFPKLDRRQIGRLVWQGLLGNFAISLCYFWAAQRIDVSLLSIILFTYPGLVLFYQIVFEKHRVSAREFLALQLSLAGAILAADPFHPLSVRIDSLGLLLAVGAAAAYAFMNVYGQKLTLEHAPMLITTVTATVSTLTILLVLPPRHWLAPHYSPVQWLFVGASGLLSTVLPMNLMYLGIRRIGAFHASVVSIVELPCILVLAYLILNERMTLPQILGGGLILLSVALIRPSGASGV